MFKLDFRNTGIECSSGHKVSINGTIECKAGDRILLIGDNGVGKSTVLMAIYSAIHHPKNKSSHGNEGRAYGHLHSLEWDTIDLQIEKGVRRNIVFQEPRMNFVSKTSADEIILPFLTKGEPAENTIAQLRNLIDAADVYHREILSQRIDNLSSGEQQRVAVAANLASSPDLLLWDEAMARVDDHSAEKLFNLIAQEFSEGVLIAATHRPQRYAKIADTQITSVIHLNRTVDGIKLIQSQALPSENDTDEEINFAKRSLWIDRVTTPSGPVKLFNNGFRIFSQANTETILRLNDFELGSFGKRIEGTSFLTNAEINEGINFVVGRNGSGKTLFLQLISGLLKLNPIFPSYLSNYGKASVAINTIGNLRSLKKKGLAVYLPAEPFKWLSEETVSDEISLFNSGEQLRRRKDILQSLSIQLDSTTECLSYGQKKILSLLSVPNDCRLVAIDEPFADLGEAFITETERFIHEQMEKKHWTSVVVSLSSDLKI